MNNCFDIVVLIEEKMSGISEKEINEKIALQHLQAYKESNKRFAEQINKMLAIPQKDWIESIKEIGKPAIKNLQDFSKNHLTGFKDFLFFRVI